MAELLPSLFRTIAEYTYDWEAWVDQAGVTRWINPAVARITGYGVAHCLALPDYPLALAYGEDRPLLARVLADAARGGSGNDVEFRIVHADGRPRWVAISWQAVRGDDEAALGYRTSIRDIDERKRIEAELHVLRRRAEAAAIARSELLANVSHELRSPIHCIAGFTDLLLESPRDPTQRRYLELIGAECTGMLRHVEDLLQLAALQAGGAQLERGRFDLGELVQRVCAAAQTIARARGLTLETDLALAPCKVEGDATRFGQIVRNLLDNALKFTEQGGVRVVAHSVVAEGVAQIELAVHDTGCGMEQADIGRLLEPFQQAQGTTTRRHGGVGLGLSIVRRLISAMHGQLSIESEPGRGTVVRVALQLPCVQDRAHVPAREVDEVARARWALVVDDSAPARELLRAMLERAGQRVVEAASGAAALEEVMRRPFDLVLLDYQMPGADGTETAVALRRALVAHGTETRTPIYLLTANVFVHEQLADGGGAIDGVLQKPLTRNALSALLAGLAKPRARPAHALLDARVIEDLAALGSKRGTSMLVEVLAGTRTDQARTLAQLAQAAHARDREALASHAHRVAGQAAVVGARRLAAQARFLERRARRAPLSTESALRAVTSLERAWHRAEEALLRAATESGPVS